MPQGVSSHGRSGLLPLLKEKISETRRRAKGLISRHDFGGKLEKGWYAIKVKQGSYAGVGFLGLELDDLLSGNL